jgi:hypothetical protein
MGAKDTMQNFFMGMAGQMTSGYGAKTISTPMGPFKWDDNINMWVNTNNGMVMSNISFQDQFAMIDYGTTDGSGLQADPVTVSISPTSWGNFTGGNAGTDIWASASGPTALIASATPVTFAIKTLNNTPTSINVSLTLTLQGLIGGTPATIYGKNALSKATYSTPFTMSDGDTLKLGVSTSAFSEASVVTITVRNAENQNVIGTVSGSFA